MKIICFLIFAICLSCTPNGIPTSGPDADRWGRMEQGSLQTYTYDPILKRSTRFTVEIKDEVQHVYPTTEQHLCAFGCSDTVTVVVDSPEEKILQAVIRPIAKNAQWTLKDGKVLLRMAPKDRYVVEINGAKEKTLLLFANPLEDNKPSKDDPNVIYFEGGKIHQVGKITLTSGKTLYLEGGCFVNGHVYCENAENIKVLGPGMLNCFPGTESAMNLKKSKIIELRDFTLLNTSAYGIRIGESSDIVADNVKSYACASELTDDGVENDSFDIHACCNVTHRHCFCYCHDDAYCIKTEKWQFSGKCDHVLYEDCIGWNVLGGNTFEIGWELGQDVSNVTYRNIYSVHSARYGSNNVYRKGAVTIHNMAGGTVSGIRYENVWIEDPLVYALCFRVGNSGSVNIGDGKTWSPGIVRDVKMKNVYISKLSQTKFGNGAEGYDPAHGVQVEIENLFIDGVKASNLTEAGFTVDKYSSVTIR